MGEEEDEEGGEPWNVAGETPRFSLGGTGGSNPPESVRDKLRLARSFSWCALRLAGFWLRSEVNLLAGASVSPELRPSIAVKQIPETDSWESLLGSGGAGSGLGQKWTGVVRRRLKTVLGLGTGFITVLLDSALVSMAARFGAELFLNASKCSGPGTAL